MKFCIKCGRRLPDEAVFCSKCGLKQPIIPEDIENSSLSNQTPVNPELNRQLPFMPASQFYNPQNMQGFYAPMQQVSQKPPPFFQAPQYPLYIELQQTVLTQGFESGEKHLNTTLFFVWSIILIFIINPIGSPIAILSILFASMARSTDTTYEQARKDLRVSKVMCIIVTCFDVLCIIAVSVLLIYSLKTGNIIIPSRSGTPV
jgi:hypothetical protein